MTATGVFTHLRDTKGMEDMKGKKVTLSSGEAAEMLGVSRETVSRLARQGLLPATRLGGSRARYRFRPADVLELASASGQR
jgi:excisionase family DNA binding protein